MISRPPRLLHFADYGASYAGSFIPMVTALARAARDRGWSVELVFSETARDKQWLTGLGRDDLTYRFLDLRSARGAARWGPAFAAEATRGRWRGRVSRSISRLLAEDPGPTILHTQFTMFDIPAAQAVRSAPQARVIWHEQSARPVGRLAEVGGNVHYRLFARDVSAIVCVAADIAETVARQGAADRVTVVPNAVDTARFSPGCLSQRAQIRERMGVGSETVMLLHFGSHWERKGGDVFLSVIRSLLGGRPPVALKAFSVGSEEAQAAVDAAGLRDHVTVLRPTERVEDLYAASDVFVSASRAEGMPFAVLEALAVGIPVVVSDIPGQAAIADAVNACRLSPLDPQIMAEAIREVLALDATTRGRQQAAAREWILENAGLESWARTITSTYTRVLDTVASH